MFCCVFFFHFSLVLYFPTFKDDGTFSPYFSSFCIIFCCKCFHVCEFFFFFHIFCVIMNKKRKIWTKLEAKKREDVKIWHGSLDFSLRRDTTTSQRCCCVVSHIHALRYIWSQWANERTSECIFCYAFFVVNANCHCFELSSVLEVCCSSYTWFLFGFYLVFVFCNALQPSLSIHMFSGCFSDSACGVKRHK